MSSYKDFERVTKYWLGELEKYNEEPFLAITPYSEWSIGQIYVHIYQYLEVLVKPAIEQCLDPSVEGEKGGKTMPGMYLFSFKKFIGKSAKREENIDIEPYQPDGLMHGRDLMIKSLKLMMNLDSKLKNASKEQLKKKIHHPTLGKLTARDWYKVGILHFYHHIDQKKKNDKQFMR